jgi:hypothetical protein
VAGLCGSWASHRRKQARWWFISRIICGHSGGGLQMVVDTVVGSWLVSWLVCGRCVECGAHELQVLATIVLVSSLSSSSTRIWKGLLCHVRRWCTMGNCRMVFSAVMVLDVVAKLGGAAIVTLRGVTGTTLRDVGSGGGALGWPDTMVVSCQMALRCFSLAVVIVGIAHPSVVTGRHCK